MTVPNWIPAVVLLALAGCAGSKPGADGSAAAPPARAAEFDITQYGAVADGTTLNSRAIQSAIDACAAAGGGTLVIPRGEFYCGALFLKPGVNVELREGSVLRVSKNIEDFPVLPNVRFEGHFAPWRSSLFNAEKCDGLRVYGPGTLDGNGATYWSAKTPQGRPRLMVIRDSKNLNVNGVRFYNSAQWNLHFYNCQDILVENSRFEIDNDGKGPSTDGVDIDSSENVTVRNCYFSVNDDCVCLKGNRYDGLGQLPKSPPVRNVLVENCMFERGHGALTLGTEAQIIRDVEMRHCVVKGNFPMLRLKMRPDTPGQDYQNIKVHHVELQGDQGSVLTFSLTHGTKVAPRPPHAMIRNVVVSDITGTFGAMGKIANNPNTDIAEITLRNINVKVKNPALDARGVEHLTVENVTVNDAPLTYVSGATTTTAPAK